MLGTGTDERERESSLSAGKQAGRYEIERWAGGETDPHPVGDVASHFWAAKTSQGLSCVPSIQLRARCLSLPLE